MTTLYVDTSALLPLLDQSDSDHPSVVETLSDLVQVGARLLTTSYTLVEAGALVKRRLGAEAFRLLGEAIDRSMDVVWVDEELHQRAWQMAADEPRHGASLVDWTGFLVMRDLKISKALALDKHFRLQGFTTLPAQVSDETENP